MFPMFGRKINLVWVLAGGYLIYLGIRQFLGWYRGDTAYPALGLASGAAFVGFGAFLLLREWRNYRRREEPADESAESVDPEV